MLLSLFYCFYTDLRYILFLFVISFTFFLILMNNIVFSWNCVINTMMPFNNWCIIHRSSVWYFFRGSFSWIVRNFTSPNVLVITTYIFSLTVFIFTLVTILSWMLLVPLNSSLINSKRGVNKHNYRNKLLILEVPGLC